MIYHICLHFVGSYHQGLRRVERSCIHSTIECTTGAESSEETRNSAEEETGEAKEEGDSDKKGDSESDCSNNHSNEKTTYKNRKSSLNHRSKTPNGNISDSDRVIYSFQTGKGKICECGSICFQMAKQAVIAVKMFHMTHVSHFPKL